MSYSFGVKIAADVAGPIEAWRDRFVGTVGIAKYRRAAGWTVDEVAKHAVVGIRQQFHKTLKRNTPWTKSAIRYNRSSPGGLNAVEQGKADGIFASVEVAPKQSTYLKFLFGVGDNTRLPGDVGLAQRHILIPWWENITLTQGVKTVSFGHLNAEVLIMTTALLSLLGITRTFGGVIGGLMLGYGKLAGSVAGVSTAIAGGGAAAGMAGAAGAAGAAGGMAGALNSFGIMAGKSGDAAAGATSKWDKFASSVKGVGSALSGLKLLGAGIAGMALTGLAPEDSAIGTGMKTAGGALTYGAAGAALGGLAGPVGAVVGGVAGAAYGGYAGYQSGQPQDGMSEMDRLTKNRTPKVTDPSVMTPIRDEQIYREMELRQMMEQPWAKEQYRKVLERDSLNRGAGLATGGQQANPDAMSRWAKELQDLGYRRDSGFSATPDFKAFKPEPQAAANPLNITIGDTKVAASQTDEQRGSLLTQIAALDGNPTFG